MLRMAQTLANLRIVSKHRFLGPPQQFGGRIQEVVFLTQFPNVANGFVQGTSILRATILKIKM